jgi:hypothetical protein
MPHPLIKVIYNIKITIIPLPSTGLPRSAQVSPGPPRSAQVRPGQPRSAQVSPGPPRLAPVRPGQPRSAQVSPGPPRSAQVRPGQPRSAQACPGPPRSGRVARCHNNSAARRTTHDRHIHIYNSPRPTYPAHSAPQRPTPRRLCSNPGDLVICVLWL